MANLPQKPVEVPDSEEATWEDWENVVRWQQTTIPGILLDESVPTQPLPLELLHPDKH